MAKLFSNKEIKQRIKDLRSVGNNSLDVVADIIESLQEQLKDAKAKLYTTQIGKTAATRLANSVMAENEAIRNR